MDIKTRLTEKDFIDLNFLLVYRKPSIKVITVLGFLFLLSAGVSKIMKSSTPISTQVIMGVAFLAGLPFTTYFAAKRNFSSNKRITENIEYIFTPERLQVIGESFKSELSWNTIYKVTKTKNWILIWQTRQIANAIPRRDIWDGEIQTLKELLQQNNIRNNL